MDKNEFVKVVEAWANGEKIQGWNEIRSIWADIDGDCISPVWLEKCKYRIKPKQTRYDDPTEDIDDILDSFDFYKTKKVMDFLNWKWASVDGNGIPDVPDLRKLARKLLYDGYAAKVANENTSEYFISTGGLCVTANTYEGNPKVYLKLSFEVCDWDNFE